MSETDNMPELLPCPFCNCDMRIESNRDWYKLLGDHSENCVFEAEEVTLTVPAHYTQMSAMIRDWSTRAAQANTDAKTDKLIAEIEKKKMSGYSLVNDEVYGYNRAIGEVIALIKRAR